ncbi:MAG: hypothetical protein HQL69_07105 [Magnetococcales bacterium]|nr:hypothetical protein [Magnetococcales bacterium]
MAAKIIKQRALRLQYGPLYTTNNPQNRADNDITEHGQEEGNPNVLQRIISTEILTNGADEKKEDGDHENHSDKGWAAFGQVTTGTVNYEHCFESQIGFALTSPLLELGGGERQITLKLEFSNHYHSGSLAPLLRAINRSTGNTQEEIITALFVEGFTIQLSSQSGWFDVDKFSAILDDKTVTITIPLPISAPSITPFDQEILLAIEEEYGPIANPVHNQPLLAFWLKQQTITIGQNDSIISIYPLSMFHDLEVDNINLGVEVKKLPATRLENTDGPIDSSSPFPFFGAVPVVGSYLLAYQPELFSKKLDSLDVHIDWFNLPDNKEGFGGYYREYFIDNKDEARTDGTVDKEQQDSSEFDNQSFKVLLSIHNPISWLLHNSWLSNHEETLENETFYLFRTLDQEDTTPHTPSDRDRTKPLEKYLEKNWYSDNQSSDEKITALLSEKQKNKLNSYMTKNLKPLSPNSDFNDLPIAPVVNKGGVLDPGKSAIKITLTTPSYGFGHSIYADSVMNAVAGGTSAGEVEKCIAKCRGGLLRRIFTHIFTDGKKLKECINDCVKPVIGPYPNEPHLLKAQNLSIDYTAKQEVTSLFHLLPFGGFKGVEPVSNSAIRVLPNFPHRGNLQIGFSGLQPGRTLTLLLHLGSGGGRSFAEDGLVSWDCLINNQWQPLDGVRVLGDGTRGLQYSGIVALQIPYFEVCNQSAMPGGLQWLRLTTDHDPDHFPNILAIYPNTVTARFHNQNNTGEHLLRSLPAGTITETMEELPNIATIAQPMNSFAGLPAEKKCDMARRVAEGLHHKTRPITGWDYERLILENFPTIWRVLLQPAKFASHSENGTTQPVTIAVIPDPDGFDTVDPLAPQVGRDMLGQIQTFLLSRISPFIQLQIVNPKYIRIQVAAGLFFPQEEDPGSCIKRLNSDLTNYLSPWFYDEERQARGGEYVSEESISEFIHNRPYVDGVETIFIHYEMEPEDNVDGLLFYTSATSHKIVDAQAIMVETQGGY